MRIVFFGTADFAVPALEAVHKDVVMVVTQPDRPSGRGMEQKSSLVKRRAQELGLQIQTPERAREPAFVSLVEGLRADALLVAAYGQILPVRLLEAARCGGINLHGSVLPRYRGAAPIQRCLLNGDTATGVTLMQMGAGMDTGDIIAIETLEIGSEETAGELFGRLAELAGRMAAEWMPRICSGDYQRIRQNEADATYAPKTEKAEAEMSFGRDAVEEFNRYRAFTPSPGAFLNTRFGHVRVSRASLRLSVDPGSGIVARVKGELTVGFRTGAIAFLEVQPEGKKRMGGGDFANGARLSVGDCLAH